MTSSKSCSECGLALANESQLTLCPTCLRATGKIADDHTLLELIQEIAPTKSSEDREPTVNFIPGSFPILHFELNPFRDPRFATFTAWEQAQIVELGRRGYQVQSKLGDGGFGVVFLAVDSAERLVAVKMLHAALTEDRYRQRFAIEANALSLLDDPALVKLYHYDVSGPDPMLVTEYVPGGTLAKQLHGRGVFDRVEAAEAIRQLAEVVHNVHEAGIVHRDIKPSNVLIGADGRYKLGDFGLAKRLDRDDDLTPTGRGIGGTPEYSAPEQFRSSGDCDGRADIYALGATLYRLLTGKPVFERKGDGDFVAVILRVLSEEPVPPRKLRPEIPRALEAVCLKCLAKNPTDRYRTAADLAADLKAWQTGADDLIARPSTLAQRVWRGARRMPKFPVAMILVALLGLGSAFLMMNRNQPQSDEEVLKELQKRYDADGRVDLQGPGGRPYWHRWDIGGSLLTDSLAADHECSFEALEMAALVLYPRAPSEKYALEGELRFTASRAGSNGDDRPFGGFFIAGRSTVSTVDDGTSVYSLLGLQFEEGPTVNVHKRIRFISFQFFRNPGQVPIPFKDGIGDAAFTASAVLPGPWRKFRIENEPEKVTPKFVIGKTENLFNVGTPDGGIVRGALQERIDHYNTRLVGVHNTATLVLPAWDHRGAIGIWSYKSAIDFKNVSLVRIP